jgi:hypothetical protein
MGPGKQTGNDISSEPEAVIPEWPAWMGQPSYGGVAGRAYGLAGQTLQPDEAMTDAWLRTLISPPWYNEEDIQYNQDLQEEILRRMDIRMRNVPSDAGQEEYRGGTGWDPFPYT